MTEYLVLFETFGDEEEIASFWNIPIPSCDTYVWIEDKQYRVFKVILDLRFTPSYIIKVIEQGEQA